MATANLAAPRSTTKSPQFVPHALSLIVAGRQGLRLIEITSVNGLPTQGWLVREGC